MNIKKRIYTVMTFTSITLIYIVIAIFYTEYMGLSVNKDGYIAIGIHSTEYNEVIVYSPENEKIADFQVVLMGKYKFRLNDDNSTVIVYPSRSDYYDIYNYKGELLEEVRYFQGEYESIETNAEEIEYNGKTIDYFGFCGYDRVKMISSNGEMMLYKTKMGIHIFRAFFIIGCYAASVFLVRYIVALFEGKYDK